MSKGVLDLIVNENTTVIDALRKIDANRLGFVLVADDSNLFSGVLTDGDARRAFIRGVNPEDKITDVYNKNARTVKLTDDIELVTELFKNEAIKFLPILDENNKVANVITKEQMHALLLQDIHADLTYDFMSLDTSVVDHEVFRKPWGFYKTTVLNDFYQSKVLSVKPHGQLSLQSHERREEHWIVVHGNGIVQLDDSVLEVKCGSSVFIPKGCRHRVTNTDEKENLVIAEVQIGDYLGEDDIIRYEDDYGRI